MNGYLFIVFCLVLLGIVCVVLILLFERLFVPFTILLIVLLTVLIVVLQVVHWLVLLSLRHEELLLLLLLVESELLLHQELLLLLLHVDVVLKFSLFRVYKKRFIAILWERSVLKGNRIACIVRLVLLGYLVPHLVSEGLVLILCKKLLVTTLFGKL